MLILSIAAGIAFHYSEFITDDPILNGNLLTVAKSNFLNFIKDFSLINPNKKWGFTPETKSICLRESIILRR